MTIDAWKIPPICERCHLQKDNIEIRKCDYMLCDSCNDEFTENQQEDDSLYQVDGAMLDGGPNSSEHENSQEENSEGPTHDKKKEEPALIHSNIEEENTGNTVLINRKAGDEKCVKCKKNVLNGIRCISCLKAWHCKCGGLNREDIKSSIVKDNKWKCFYCIPSEKDCNVCKLKDKEINHLKKCIADIEKNYASLCNEMKLCSERSTDLEDRLAKEKNLRKQIERELKDLNEANKAVYKDSCSSCYGSDSSSDESGDDEMARKRTRRRSRSTPAKSSKGEKKSSQKVKSKTPTIRKRQPVSSRKQNGDLQYRKSDRSRKKSVEVERQLEKDLHEDQRDVMYEKQLNQYQRNCPYVQEGQHLQNAIDFLKKYRKQSFENEDGWDYTDTDGIWKSALRAIVGQVSHHVSQLRDLRVIKCHHHKHRYATNGCKLVLVL